MWSESGGQLIDSPVSAAAPELLQRETLPHNVSFTNTHPYIRKHTNTNADSAVPRGKLHMDLLGFVSMSHLHVNKYLNFTSKPALQTCTHALFEAMIIQVSKTHRKGN